MLRPLAGDFFGLFNFSTATDFTGTTFLPAADFVLVLAGVIAFTTSSVSTGFSATFFPFATLLPFTGLATSASTCFFGEVTLTPLRVTLPFGELCLGVLTLVFSSTITVTFDFLAGVTAFTFFATGCNSFVLGVDGAGLFLPLPFTGLGLAFFGAGTLTPLRVALLFTGVVFDIVCISLVTTSTDADFVILFALVGTVPLAPTAGFVSPGVVMIDFCLVPLLVFTGLGEITFFGVFTLTGVLFIPLRVARNFAGLCLGVLRAWGLPLLLCFTSEILSSTGAGVAGLDLFAEGPDSIIVGVAGAGLFLDPLLATGVFGLAGVTCPGDFTFMPLLVERPLTGVFLTLLIVTCSSCTAVSSACLVTAAAFVFLAGEACLAFLLICSFITFGVAGAGLPLVPLLVFTGLGEGIFSGVTVFAFLSGVIVLTFLIS